MIHLKALALLFLLVISAVVSAENRVGSQGFPRLGMWWPDPETQPLSDIARYDFVTLFDYQESFVAPLKAQNPQLILLNSTNACELSYDDSNISEIPAEWFLTQVGSTLSISINATTTTINVANLTVSDGENSFALFVPGDTALIEGESIKILSVDEASKTLTVERGHIRPASAHTAGTRIAAHITFWPNSWLLNLSTLSPTATLDPAIGAERWGDYNARFGAGLLTNPDWDGLLIDRADPDQSWLVGGSNARTIDPDQSNTLITDYSAFDNAWNAGLRNYQNKLRQLLGSDKTLFTNWGIDNYDLINGNNYEGFPLEDGSSYRGSWHNTVFGSIENVGSYAQWMEQGIQPNLTMIETYEDDGSPAPGDLSYNNPCAQADFVPNYRKMRFGLTTALLNDGYFSWEINTNGHGSLCLKWFDEYDNVGQGRGYLGQPLGVAYQPSGLTVGANQFVGGTFENQDELDLWDFWADSGLGNAATISLDVRNTPSGTSAAQVEITQTSGVDWQIALTYRPFALEAGADYTITFWAKADRQRAVSMWAQMTQAPWTSYLSSKEQMLDTGWQHFEYTAKSDGSDNQAEFSIGFGQAVGSVWIDDIRIEKGSRDVWRRDFSGGSVVVNATNAARTIELGQDFRKINGTQDPAINDGSTATQVTIPPLDGLVLLPVPCSLSASVLNLPSNQWHQISLPCALPINSQTAQVVFGDDLNGVYGTDWIIFSFDPVANKYIDIGLDGVLTQGVGYWIIHTNEATVELDLPMSSTQTAITPSNQCVSINGCYSIPLTTQAEGAQWNMSGYPFSNTVALNRWRVVTKRGVCVGGCTLDQAKTNNIVDSKLWHFNGEAYEQLRGNVQIAPWSGFWVVVIAEGNTLEPTLEIPVD